MVNQPKAAERTPKSVASGYDFTQLLYQSERLKALEVNTAFRIGGNAEIARVLVRLVRDICADEVADELVQFLDGLRCFGRETEFRKVFLNIDESRNPKGYRSFGRLVQQKFDRVASRLGFSWSCAGFVNIYPPIIDIELGGVIYSDRSNKSENAPAFLKRVYADELAAGSITLSDLRSIDKSLWAGLRNWASAGKHDLDAVISRGKTVPGPPPNEGIDFDPAVLDPNNPKDALALQALKHRAANRRRVAAHYRRIKNQPN